MTEPVPIEPPTWTALFDAQRKAETMERYWRDAAAERDEVTAEVSRLTSALSTAEQERDKWKGIRDTREGCCRAAVDSDGHAHDHVEWYCDLIAAEAELERTREVVDAAKAYVDEHDDLIVATPVVSTGSRLAHALDALRTDKEGADDR